MKKYEYVVKEPEQKKPERVVKRPEYDFNKKDSGTNRKLLIPGRFFWIETIPKAYKY